MEPSDGKDNGPKRPARRKKRPAQDLRFEPPGPQTGDTLRIILQRGPSGEPIVDTYLSNRGAHRDRVTSEVIGVLLQVTDEVRALARETPGPHTAPIEKLTKGLELLAALVRTKLP